MNYDQVEKLNYCTDAIEAIKKSAQSMLERAPRSAAVSRRVADMLDKSVKFVLPNCCNLVGPDDLKQAHLDMMRLPYPLVAFEASWDTEEKDSMIKEGEFKQATANKRIALCWNPSQEYEILPGLNDQILTKFPEGGIFVLPVYFMTDAQQWIISVGGCFVPYENEVFKRASNEGPATSQLATQAAIQAGMAKENSSNVRAEPFYVQPELYENALKELGGDKDKALAHLLLDSRDEASMMIQACSVLNCANVTTELVDAPKFINSKRLAKGKTPFYSYHVLQVSQDKRTTKTNGAGGIHASPRMHLRRGHLRRLEDKVVWVNPAMVNAGASNGIALKDYAVNKK